MLEGEVPGNSQTETQKHWIKWNMGYYKGYYLLWIFKKQILKPVECFQFSYDVLEDKMEILHSLQTEFRREFCLLLHTGCWAPV